MYSSTKAKWELFRVLAVHYPRGTFWVPFCASKKVQRGTYKKNRHSAGVVSNVLECKCAIVLAIGNVAPIGTYKPFWKVPIECCFLRMIKKLCTLLCNQHRAGKGHFSALALNDRRLVFDGIFQCWLVLFGVPRQALTGNNRRSPFHFTNRSRSSSIVRVHDEHPPVLLRIPANACGKGLQAGRLYCDQHVFRKKN